MACTETRINISEHNINKKLKRIVEVLIPIANAATETS